jgi:hypothetical protein
MAQRSILFSPSELHAGQRITIHFGGPFGNRTRVLLAMLLPSTNSYKSLRPDPPPRFENVETIKSTGTTPQPQLRQWQNYSLDSFRVSPAGILNDGISGHGHCNYDKHGQHD